MRTYLLQIGLVDVLFDLGIVPDVIVGQSLGELCCGYADGALDLDQTISAAYYRGLVSVESVFPPGAMAAVGKLIFLFLIKLLVKDE